MKRLWIALGMALLLAGCAASPPAAEPPAEEPSTQPAAAAETAPAVLEDDPLETQALEILGGMTQEQKIAQLFFISPEALTGAGSVTDTDEDTQKAFEACPVGGVIYSDGNFVNAEQTRDMLSGMQQISRDVLGIPVFLGVDEEGGTVARVSGSGRFDTEVFPDMAAVDSPERAREIGDQIGACLRDLGFNLDFAPVADVLTNPDNTVVRRRAFSDDPGTVTQMCAAFSEGLQSQNVLACYKHFPGHGNTAEDSHDGFACSMHMPEELDALALPPFRDAAGRDIPFIMVGHITLPNVMRWEKPASLSYEMVTLLLRRELGFRGVAITDSLDMGAVTQNGDAGNTAVLAVLAGEDMLLISQGFPAALEAVTRAVENGTIPAERLDEAVGRIIYTKLLWQNGE